MDNARHSSKLFCQGVVIHHRRVAVGSFFDYNYCDLTLVADAIREFGGEQRTKTCMHMI